MEQPYHFWIIAATEDGVWSDPTACAGSGTEIVNMAEWQRSYHCPWKKKGLTIPPRLVQSGDSLDVFSVPSGKVWLLTGFSLAAAAGVSMESQIQLSGRLLLKVIDGASITIAPQMVNGVFLSGRSGDSIGLRGTGVGCTASARVEEFDEDWPNIDTKFFGLNAYLPYTVPSGKNFVLCFAYTFTNDGLMESNDGGSTWNLVLPGGDITAPYVNFSISGNGGVLLFSAGTQLKCSGLLIVMLGYEIAAP